VETGIERFNRWTDAFKAVAEILAQFREPEELIAVTLDEIAKISGVNCCWLQQVDEKNNNRLILQGQRGFTPEMIKQIKSLKLTQGVIGKVVLSRKPTYIADIAAVPDFSLSSFVNAGLHSLIAYPVVSEQTVVALLGMCSRHRGEEVRENGERFPASVPLALMKDKKGKAYDFIEIGEDITEHKRAEEVLKREKERAEEYLNIAGVMLATINADENITLINKKGCEILGYEEGELIGRNWFDTLIPQRMRNEIRGVFAKLMAGDVEPVEYYENPLLTKGGEERIIAFHNTVTRDSDGQIIGVLFSGEDITERKRVEELLRREAEEKARLMNIVVHELGVPLTPTLSSAQMLADELERRGTETDKRLAKNVLDGAVVLRDRLNDFVDLTKGEMSLLKVFRQPTDIAELVDNIALQCLAMFGNRKQRFHLEIKPQLPQVLVDKTRTGQILFNLLSNASKFSPEGTAIVLRAKKRGDKVIIQVWDSGPGIDLERRRKLFNLHSYSDDNGNGFAGLGLFICKSLVELQGGKIWVRSRPGEGSAFSFSLPLASKN